MQLFKISCRPIKLIVSILICCSMSLVSAEPLVVAINSTPHLRSPKKHEPYHTAAVLSLTQRLQQDPNVHLLSDERSYAIFQDIKSATGLEELDLLKAFNSYLPIDAVIHFHSLEETELVQAKLYFKGKSHLLQVRDSDLQKACLEVYGKVAKLLGLPATSVAAYTKAHFPNGDLFRLYHATRVWTMMWPMNSGEARLKMYRRHANSGQKNPLIWKAILEDVIMTVASRTREGSYVPKALPLSLVAIPHALNESNENDLRRLIDVKPKYLAQVLSDMAKPLIRDEADDLLDDIDSGDEPDSMPEEKVSRELRRCALRLLSSVDNMECLEIYQQAKKSADTEIREDVARACSFSKVDASLDILKDLGKDSDVGVRLLANRSLKARQKQSTKLRPLALQVLKNKNASKATLEAALQTLSESANSKDAKYLMPHLDKHEGNLNASIIEGLARMGALSEDQVKTFLQSHDHRVVLAALKWNPSAGAKKNESSDKHKKQLLKVANDPMLTLSTAALMNMAPFLPKDPKKKLLFELRTEQMLVRMHLLDQLVEKKEAWAMAAIDEACAYKNVYVRMHALKHLAKLSPDKVQAHVEHNLRHNNDWLRLQNIVWVHNKGLKLDKTFLSKLHEREKDPAIKSYLAESLARVSGTPLPSKPVAAHRLPKDRTLSWKVSIGQNYDTSPFDAYYCMKLSPGDRWIKAHERGKFIMGRMNDIPYDPGYIYVYQLSQENWWRDMNKALPLDILPVVDGVVLGEETMAFKSKNSWPYSWRAFCKISGIDAKRVNGDMSKLDPRELEAYRRWSNRLSIRGFNLMHDYVKDRFGRLRPGIQVATFAPYEVITEASAYGGEENWKFDIGALYDYKGCNRTSYNIIRRYKTLWPERRVVWFSLGIGGYEMNPIKSNQTPPSELMHSTKNRAWSDSVSAYAAGADVGWFTHWIWTPLDWKGTMATLKGATFDSEDIWPKEDRFTLALDSGLSHEEVEKLLIRKSNPKMTGMKKVLDDTDPELALEDASDKKEIAKAIKVYRKKFRTGYNIYRKYLNDCARIFNGLPITEPKPNALFIRPGMNIWYMSPTNLPAVPGMALLPKYDYLLDIDQCVNRDLSKYRFIAIHNPKNLTQESMNALKQWLKSTPGILYIHGDLSADNQRKTLQPGDMQGNLAGDWPWEEDFSLSILNEKAERESPELELHDSTAQKPFRLKAQIYAKANILNDSRTKVVLSKDKDPVLFSWNHSDYKGRVIVDTMWHTSRAYLDVLAKTINAIHKESGAGIAVDLNDILYQAIEDKGMIACAASSRYRDSRGDRKSTGIDFMSGLDSPTLNANHRASLSSSKHRGKYLYSDAQTVILSQHALKPQSKSLHGQGLLRVSKRANAQNDSKWTQGLKSVKKKSSLDWILFKSEPGFYRDQSLWIRSPSPILIQ